MSDTKQYNLDQKQLDQIMAHLEQLETLLVDKIHLLRKLNPNPKLRKTKTHVIKLHAELWAMQKDECEFCLGTSGGILGNENIIDGVKICDHCHAELEDKGE